MEVTLPLAVVAGLVSFASPCFLPVVPAFVAQLIGAEGEVKPTRADALWRSVTFVLGFSVVFIALWAVLGLVGSSVGAYAKVLRVVGGVVLIVMGLHVAGLIDIGLLNRVVRLPAPRGGGLARSLVTGVVFGAGWTPCIGPILGGILALAVTSDSAAQGIGLMLAYCLGLGVPVVLVAVGVVEAKRRFAWFECHHMAISLVSGGILVAIGFLMLTNQLARLAAIIPGFGA